MLSFACYLPVVLFSNNNRLVGMLMIPKTLAYLWIVYTGYQELRWKAVCEEQPSLNSKKPT
jgi:hypothetical protein